MGGGINKYINVYINKDKKLFQEKYRTQSKQMLPETD